MGNLTTEQYRQIKEDVVVIARRYNIARMLMPVRGPLGLGMRQYSYTQLTELSDAIISHTFETRDMDNPNIPQTNVNIPVLQKTFEIDALDIASAARAGQSLDTMAAGSAAYKVTYAENDLVINGFDKDGSTYDVEGLYEAADNTQTGSSFGTAGYALASVTAAMGDLMDDSIMAPYNLVLHPDQYAELKGSVMSNGDREFTHIKDILGGGDIYTTAFIAAGTGMVLSTPQARLFELVIGQDMTVETVDIKKDKVVFGRVYETCAPVIYDTNAICTLTSI